MEWISREVFARLGQDTGEELLPALVQIFVEDGQQNLLAIDNAFASHDAEELCLLAHTLKSVCATYGAVVCHDHALGLEQACRRHDWRIIQQWVNQLKTSLPHSLMAIQDLVSEPRVMQG